MSGGIRETEWGEDWGRGEGRLTGGCAGREQGGAVGGETHCFSLRSHTTREINGRAAVATHVTIISREIFLLRCQRRGFEDWT